MKALPPSPTGHLQALRRSVLSQSPTRSPATVDRSARRTSDGPTADLREGALALVGVFTQSVGVELDPGGTPRYLDWQGRRYVVAAEPVRWYERRRWWEEERRVERGRGAGLIDHEIWRLQVRLAAARRGPLVTLDVAHHHDSGRWRLIRVHDGAAAPVRQSA